MQWEALIEDVLRRARPESERKQVRSRRTEQQILAAALRVFGRNGIARSRMVDIAAEAGISAPTLYEYHGCKEDIAYVVSVSYLTEFYAEFSDAVSGGKTARHRIRRYLSLMADFVRRNPEWARLFYLEIWPSALAGESAPSKSIDDFSRILICLIRQGMDDGEWPSSIDIYETAALLIGGLNHVIITWLLHHRPRNVARAGAAVVERTLAMLGLEQPYVGGPSSLMVQD